MQWIDDQLKQRGMARARLAESIPGLTETKISLIMSGERKISAFEADEIRRFFGYRLPDDPPTKVEHRIADQLAMLGEEQKHAVVLYLEALLGKASEPPKAS